MVYRLFVAVLMCYLCAANIVRAQEQTPDLKKILIANVRDFGAKGDGKTDDTAAIEKAWAFVMDGSKPQFKDQWSISVNTILYFPQGIYRYAGEGLKTANNSTQTWEIKGDGVNSARIDIISDVYFITCGRVQSTTIRDISFNGGKGVFKSTHTGNMVGGNHVFENAYFFGYSECAIGNNANDAPYLMVNGCIFHCRKGSEAIGIAWGGDIADSHIMRSHFEQNAYHIKLGDHLGNAFQIGPRNLFLSFGGTKTKADIWLVPNLKGPVNSGQAAIISENKFGNENYDPERPRILIAAEDNASGADRLTRKPSEEITAKNESIFGVKLKDNLFAGGGGPKRGLVFSRVLNTTLIFDHNQFFGSIYPYLIEFDSRIERLSDNARAGRAYVYSQEFFNGKLSNLPGYAIVDDLRNEFAGAGESLAVSPQSDDPSYIPFVSMAGKDMPITGKATVNPTTDSRGNRTAAAVRIENSVSGFDIKLDNTDKLVEGRIAYIDVELKAASSKSLEHIHVAILNKNAAKESAGRIVDEQRVFSRKILLQPYWQRVTIPFMVRDTRNAAFHLTIRQLGWYGNEVIKDVKDGFECGNVRVYHAKAPVGLNREGVRVANDQDIVLNPGIDPEQIIFGGSLTAERAIGFVSPSASIRPLIGTRFKISRNAGGNAPLKVGTLTNLGTGEWCDVVYDGTQFQVIAKGKLN